MCGIAGVLKINSSIEALVEQVADMLAALTHRGPDSFGHWQNETGSICLGHRRLAIQDLSPLGNQPMVSASGRYVVSFNGEIYNFEQLRQDLETQGVRFRGHSDTEVLLALIENDGIERAITLCKGMFAIALYDQHLGMLHLCRDRLGEKPLYYGIIDGLLMFASELKSIYAITSARELTIDKSALAGYLRYGYVSAPQSIFESIRKLKPGHILSLDCKSRLQAITLTELVRDSKSYWSSHEAILAAQNNLYQNEAAAIGRLDELLHKVIQEQSIADVPIGAFLSGGIDSSVVSAILQSSSAQRIDTFTIGFNDPQYNEAAHAHAIAKHIGSQHHEFYISAADVLNQISAMPTMYDEPFADSSQLPMALVCQLAKQKVTVCLSGDGGDELFGGYNRYLYPENVFRNTSNIPTSIRPLFSRILKRFPPDTWDTIYHAFVKLTGRNSGAAFGLKIHKLADVISQPDLASIYQYLCSYWQTPERLVRGASDEIALMAGYEFNSCFLDAAMQWDQDWYLPGDNLVKTDRASMAVSLEMRLPLLDQEMVEFAWQVPNRMKIKNKQTKWLLRQVLYRYVPAKLIDRPKMGFSVPIAQWIRHELRDWARELLAPALIEDQGLLDAQEILQIYQQHMSGKFDHSHKLWTILMFQAWYQEHIANSDRTSAKYRQAL